MRLMELCLWLTLGLSVLGLLYLTTAPLGGRRGGGRC